MNRKFLVTYTVYFSIEQRSCHFCIGIYVKHVSAAKNLKLFMQLLHNFLYSQGIQRRITLLDGHFDFFDDGGALMIFFERLDILLCLV
ncbi:hypothetical protein D3C71_1995880 [compost metagenome]